MIIWSGLGILVGVIVVVCQLLASLLATTISADPDYYSLHGWVMGAGFLAAALACWLLEHRLAATGLRIKRDVYTGKAVVARRRHSLFFIPVRWWVPVLAVAAVGASLVNTTPEELQRKRKEREIQNGLKRTLKGGPNDVPDVKP